jgi:hypothetical protein
MALLASGTGGIGYLLKDRVGDAEELASSAKRVAAGGSAIDPAVVEEIVRGRANEERLVSLTPREREVLALVAEGRSNPIGRRPPVDLGEDRRGRGRDDLLEARAGGRCRRQPAGARRTRLPGRSSLSYDSSMKVVSIWARCSLPE